MPTLGDRARRLFESPRAPWVIVAVALVVSLPSIQLGFYDDDHAFRAGLAGLLPEAPPAWDLYRFTAGDVETNRALVEAGVFPWWTAPTLKLHLVRPLAGLLFEIGWAPGPLGMF
jgi:hypothetical protein